MNAKKDKARIFVSVAIPDELRQKVSALAGELPKDAVKPVTLQNIHLTLRFIGQVQSKRLGEIEQKLREISFSRFRLSLSGAGVFPNADFVKIVWVGAKSEGLESLAKKVGQALAGTGNPEAPEFSPHITLARVRKKIDASGFLEKHREEEFGSFFVDRFFLMQSELEYGKPPRYTVISEFKALNQD